MASLEYFLVAESLSLDQATNRISIFNVLEIVAAPELPVVQQTIAISSWNIPPEERGQTFRVVLRVHPPGEEAWEQAHVLEPSAASRRRSILGWRAFPFDRPGDWRFEVRLGDGGAGREASHLITVSRTEAERRPAGG